MKQSLVEIFKEIGHFGNDIGCNDKGGQHSYLETYDELFKPFKNKSTILEIGLAMGDSLILWDKYFSDCHIIGADITVVFEPKGYKNNKVDIVQADATAEDFVSKLPLDQGELFDVVVDDGSHLTQHQITTFNLLKGKMKKGGIYIIEDLLALDVERENYLALHPSAEIIDLRHVKGRFDDALVIIYF